MSDYAVAAPLVVNASGASNRGLRRTHNEDALLAEFPVFIVADGMGGHQAGDVASSTVIEAFRPFIGRDDLAPEDVFPLVRRAHQLIEQATEGADAGTTLTGVIAVRCEGERRWLVVNIGDSRVYRSLDDHFDQLTVDHSIVQELLERGELLPEDAATFPGRNVITRALGDFQSEADFWLLPVVTGERLLVCSDGLSGELADDEIRAALLGGGSTDATVLSLIDQALVRGGRDNITAIVVDVESGGIEGRIDDYTAERSLSAIEDTYGYTIDINTQPSERRRQSV